jgi:chromate transport protein ChrA
MSRLKWPLVSISLVVVPILLLSSGWTPFLFSPVLLVLLLSPFVGMAIGILALTKGKKQIGIVGMVIAIVAIVLPSAAILAIVVALVGVTTGMIPLM